jgi:LuxR family maltose regulon positive regulatory protein
MEMPTDYSVSHLVDWAKAWRAHIELRSGEKRAALKWATTTEKSRDMLPAFVTDRVNITLARCLVLNEGPGMHGDRLLKAVHGLEELLESTKGGTRTKSRVEVLVVQALVHDLLLDRPAALQALEEALSLAEPNGFVRVFIDEGAPMVVLLRQLIAQGTRTGYAKRLLSELSEGDAVGVKADRQPTVPSELFSEREREVLRLLAANLSNREIADTLYVSVNTVKTHLKRIYEKMAVKNRHEATSRAAEFGLL